MDNQHKKITRYRDLSQAEIDLMNLIKEKSAELGGIINMVLDLRDYQMDFEDPEESFGLPHDSISESFRCLDIAKEHLQTGTMWLTRAVALPQSF